MVTSEKLAARTYPGNLAVRPLPLFSLPFSARTNTAGVNSSGATIGEPRLRLRPHKTPFLLSTDYVFHLLVEYSIYRVIEQLHYFYNSSLFLVVAERAL